MKLLLAITAVVAAYYLQCEAKTFTRCGLVQELRRKNFPEGEMRDWVCLIEHESGRRTDIIGPPNRDGSRDHGLFQINDHLWCNDSNVPGKDCHATCADYSEADNACPSRGAISYWLILHWVQPREDEEVRWTYFFGVCLVEKESGRRTDVIGPPNSDGSRDHGLFQINDRYWCNDSNVPGKECHVTCQQLRTDDINVASTCAKKIYRRHGFNAWYAWRDNCKGKHLPDISKC